MKIEFNRNLLFYNNFRRFICAPILHLIYNFAIEGRENLPEEGPSFILSKHQSWLDLFVICYVSRVPLYYVAKQEIFENIFGDFKRGFLYNAGRFLQGFITRCLYCLGAIPISRENPKETITSFKYMEKLLNEKEIIVFFPEGRFVRDAMGDAKTGLIRWMMHLQKKKKTQYPVITMGIRYKKAFPRINLTCRIGPAEYYETSDEEVTKKIMESIRKLSDL